MGTRAVLKPSFVRFEISTLRCPKSCSSFGRREDMALPTPLTAASLGRNVPLEKPFLTWAPSYHPVNLRGFVFLSSDNKFHNLTLWLIASKKRAQ